VEIAEYYLARKAHTAEVTANDVATLTAGYTPVRIEKLFDEALMIALRNGRREMTIADVTHAQLAVEVGLAQDAGYHPDEKRRVAIHESGHALAAVLAGRDVRLASILRRSSSLGLVAHAEADERYLRTPAEAAELITIALAGRAAELHEFGSASSGIASDLSAATTIACQLIGQLGGGDSLVSFEAALIPGAGNLVAKVLSDDSARLKVDELLNSCADRAACIMLEHRVALIALADALCMYDELDGQQVHRVLAAACAS
jgi:ATP-dependent Zn protease